MAKTTNTQPAARPSVLDRARAKHAALEELAGRLSEENGGHRPLTADERKIQKDNALSVAELDAYQAWLWGQWIATTDLYIGGVCAFPAGGKVPTTHVEQFGWDVDGSVEPSPAALAAAAVAPADTPDPVVSA